MSDLEPDIDEKDSPAPRRRRQQVREIDPVPLGRSLILPGVILVVIGITAAWSLVGWWAAAGIVVAGAAAVTAIFLWRPRPRGHTRTRALFSKQRAQKTAATGSVVPRATRSGRPAARTRTSPTAARTRTSPTAARTRTPPTATRTRTPSPGGRSSSSTGSQRRATGSERKQRRQKGQGWKVALAVVKWLGRNQPKNAGPKAEAANKPPAPAAPKTETAHEAATEQEAPAVPQPQPGPAVPPPAPHPTDIPAPSEAHGGPVNQHIQAAADAIYDHIGGAVFENMADFTNFVGSVDVLLEAVYGALGTVNARFSDDEPVNPLVIDHLEELRALLRGPIEFAREGSAVFNAAHRDDLERLDQPRPGEEKMDYSRQ